MALVYNVCLILTIILSSPFVISAQADSQQCNASSNDCNCQFNNVLALSRLIQSEIATARMNEPAAASGVTYTRWGKSSCPSSTGAQLVYSGRAGGTQWHIQGGSAEKICLPDDPEYANETSGLSISQRSTVYGVEYQLPSGPNANVYNHNAPCAVCFVPSRATAIVVPARITCPSSWTREYHGYLMTEIDSSTHYRSVYNCLDGSPDVLPGSNTDDHIALFHYAVTGCTGLSCPPYESGRILSCVVCTK